MFSICGVILYYLIKEIIGFLTEKFLVICVHKKFKIFKIKNILTFIYICWFYLFFIYILYFCSQYFKFSYSFDSLQSLGMGRENHVP